MAGLTVVGHRGDPVRARENTLASFRAAIAAGADAVELDVRTTRDGVPVVLHDPTLRRLWGHDRPVAELTAREVAEVTGGRVPTLAQALAVTASVRTLVDLPEPSAATARAAVAAVREADATGRVYYCGDPAALRAVRATDEDRDHRGNGHHRGRGDGRDEGGADLRPAEIALTWKRTAPPRPSLLRDLSPRWLNYRFGLVDRDTVAHARDEGYLLSVWTPDSGAALRRLMALGVDAITTNRPLRLRGLLTRR
ncbi:glycerophosphodiester phosphodiesterase [Streptomyces sp. 4N509B]|uniref:glycerophosphodiester phosphodiesterase n=1 Tax=Streptomyces sp. 4N509B TaxID=3457413 RepID=UPI003FD2DBF8